MHTPGPWTVTPDTDLWGTYIIAEAETHLVEELMPSDESKAIDEANARLIAAAPELLEALVELFRFSEPKTWRDSVGQTLHTMVEAAIRKALDTPE